MLFALTEASVGKSYIYDIKDGKVYYAGFLIRARINATTNPEFIFQNTLTKKYKKFVSVTSQRSGQPGINAKVYKNYYISMPQIDEQDKIGKFLKSLDNNIILHHSKANLINLIKKEYLHKMFL
ncbi:restriction endonuclease subunit S [Jeotgalicoccus aerolatus]|uniref:restriction endonuclease subunit S n=1 Tax=Jeotgalicoccus aerolatus TaxID=709510 RepID=UPI001ABB86E7|nr:restriction endonuclease subunit S [Jeotgalicoccus aerolatus]